MEYSYRSVILSFVSDTVCMFTTILLYFSQCGSVVSLCLSLLLFVVSVVSYNGRPVHSLSSPLWQPAMLANKYTTTTIKPNFRFLTNKREREFTHLCTTERKQFLVNS